jgi:K+/H+ antiporter YhaU regulatory subunit KhtT
MVLLFLPLGVFPKLPVLRTDREFQKTIKTQNHTYLEERSRINLLNNCTETINEIMSDSDSESSEASSSERSDAGTPNAEPVVESEAEQHYLQRGNCKKVLISMALGVRDDNGKEIADWVNDERFPKSRKKQWAPQKGLLCDEIKRRLSLTGKPAKTNHQQKLETAVHWLKDNPIEEEEGILFLKKTISELLITFQLVDYGKPKNNVAAATRDQWSGIVPFLRVIHCLTDHDEIKQAFQAHFVVMTRRQLDGRHNQLTMQQCPWTLAADKWNDPEYNPMSRIFADLHDEFGVEIDLSHDVVQQMGTLTGDKAKQKFSKLKNDLIIVKSNWEISGNGDGSLARVVRDDMDDTEMELINANDKCNFLQGKSPAVLYLWGMAEQHDLMNTVCQQLNDDSTVDSCLTPPNIMGSGRRNKRKMDFENDNDGDDNSNNLLNELKSTIVRSNEIAEQSLEFSLRKEKSEEHYRLATILGDLQKRQDDTEDKMDGVDENTPKWTRLNEKLEKINERVRFYERQLGSD